MGEAKFCKARWPIFCLLISLTFFFVFANPMEVISLKLYFDFNGQAVEIWNHLLLKNVQEHLSFSALILSLCK